MCLSEKASERARLTKVSRNDAKLNVKCAEMSTTQKSERVDLMKNETKADSLMSIIDRNEIETKRRNSNYNKRAIPFDRTNTKHVEALQAMCDMFVDPWDKTKSYKRVDLTDCLSEFIISIKDKKTVVMRAEQFEALYALAKCETDRREAIEAKKAKKTTKRKTAKKAKKTTASK